MELIKILVVEDSPLMRNFLAERIGHAPGFEVIATAHNGADALEKLLSEGPDVITLDVELPDTNGIDLLEKIMQTRPTSVVMVSALTQSGAQTTLRALQLGAVDFVGKPTASGAGEPDAWIAELLLKLRRAASIRPARLVLPFGDAFKVVTDEPTIVRAPRKCNEKVVLVGGGSGATEAARRLVLSLPRDCPALLVALQCSPIITKAMLVRLSRESPLQLKVANDGEMMIRGHVYLGPGDAHVGVVRMGAQWHIKLQAGEPIRGYRPNLDSMFESGSKFLGQEIAGVLLDAAGDDGMVGLKLLATNHSRTYLQAREDQAIKLPRPDRPPSATRSYVTEPLVLPLDKIPDALFGN